MKIKKVTVREASTLAASATAYTSAVNVLGASEAWFHISAADANQLASGVVPEISFDGTNWRSTSTSTCTSGFLLSATSGTSCPISVALNTGGVVYGPRLQTFGASEIVRDECIKVPLMRLKMVAGASDITGLTVIAYVAYRDSETTLTTGESSVGPTP